MNQLKILIIGSGGREHAIAWKLVQSPQVAEIFIAPGNAGTALVGTNVPIEAEDVAALAVFARENGIDLTAVGPELPLAMGIVDTFQAAGLTIFGPTQGAARLEASKAFAKAFMQAQGIPTAKAATFTLFAEAKNALPNFMNAEGVVIKASGLAGGKGVVVCDTLAQAEAALQEIMQEKAFGAAGDEVLIEERMVGAELSLLVLTDGKTAVPLMPARDHKRAYDNNEGPNTGGMGVFGPPADVDQALIDDVMATIIEPTIQGMAAQATPYAGVLYAGVMLTASGPKVIEFNCRFGDPETQVVLPMLDGDLAEIMLACAEGRLTADLINVFPGSAVTVVMASPGYPTSYPKGLPITGLDNVPDNAIVFHAGTSQENGQIVTSGGRVLCVTALAAELETAVSRAYATLAQIHFDGAHYRTDIGRQPTSKPLSKNAYAHSGVNIAAGHEATTLMKTAVQATFGPEVLSDVGNFGGLYSAMALKEMVAPVLVASTDGVGTKTMVAAALNRWDTIGQDIVNHALNDILVQGAQPLFFLDYVATSKLEPQKVAEVVGGAAKACQEAGCALLGGETAEMPGVYQDGELDLVGTIVGVVEKGRLINGRSIQAGDIIFGIPSSGLHTNGYTLARTVLADLDWHTAQPILGTTVGEALLAVHRSYLSHIRQLWSADVAIHGLVHITGGGLIDNPPRIFPNGLGAILHQSSWPIPPIFSLIQQLGNIPDAEMHHVFNMGLGMLVIVSPAQAELVKKTLGDDVVQVGEIVEGEKKVVIS